MELTKSILELADVQQIQPDFQKLLMLNKNSAEQIQSLIFGGTKTKLYILTTNAFPDKLHTLLKQLEDKKLLYIVYYTDVESFKYALGRYDLLTQRKQEFDEKRATQLEALGDNAIKLIYDLFEKRDSMEDEYFMNELIRLSFKSGASDLHFQPGMTGVTLRLRQDGLMKNIVEFPRENFPRYLQKIKFISGVKLNIDYIPQDGRFSFDATSETKVRKIDVRVSFMPALGMESVVMRFLDAEQGIKSFSGIGFTGENLDSIQRGIRSPNGMILVVGPTGSGKTTTLYSMLGVLNDGKKKIITLEDPIEYEIQGLQQSQMNFKKGYDFEEGLKATLRHDPDIIFVGEIRTLETASIAINSALTGHLVFSTLHTNSAIETVSRLINMGVVAYMLAPSLSMIIGQRLVRKLCSCAVKKPADFGSNEEIKKAIKKLQDVKPTLELPYDGNLYQPVGCEKCNGEGYKGRIAIVEILEIDDRMKERISSGATTIELYAQAREHGFITMKEDGYIKMLQGETSLEEIRRVI